MKFKPGDKVLIARKVEKQDGWTNHWIDIMDSCIGKIGTVGDDPSLRRLCQTREGVLVRITDEKTGLSKKWFYPTSALELVGKKIEVNGMNKPHPHADLIKEWADGEKIQYFGNTSGRWHDCLDNKPEWDPDTRYRVKPKSKSKVKKWRWLLIRSDFDLKGDIGDINDTSEVLVMCANFYTEKEAYSFWSNWSKNPKWKVFKKIEESEIEVEG